MIWVRLTFGGFGRRFIEALAAAIILAATSATVAASLMVVEGARNALARATRQDRPDVVQVKSRFNRALFETPRSGNLPPLTIPVYEPLIDPAELEMAAGDTGWSDGSRCFVTSFPQTAFSIFTSSASILTLSAS